MIGRSRVLRKLELELQRVRRTLNLDRDLSVKWLPGQARHIRGRRVVGEIIDSEVRIYVESASEALLVLRHEVLEYAILEKFTMPYKRTINLLLAALEEQIYFEKEQLVRKLSHLIWGRKRDRIRGRRTKNEHG